MTQSCERSWSEKVKGVRSFTSSIVASQANFGLGPFLGPTSRELAAEARMKMYHQMMESMRDSIWRLISNVQSQMPHIQFDNNLLLQMPNFNQQAILDVEEEDEDEYDDLGANQC